MYNASNQPLFGANGGATNNNKALKILVAGGAQVGKTCLLRNFNGLEFNTNYVPTVNTDFSVKSVTVQTSVQSTVQTESVSVQLWDIGATSSMGKSFFRNTHACVFVVDCTQIVSQSQQQTANSNSSSHMQTLNEAYERVCLLANFADNSFPCLLVVNKVDMLPEGGNERALVTETVANWVKSRRSSNDYPISVMDVSAKTGLHVTEAFQSIINAALLAPAKLLPASASFSANSAVTTASAKSSEPISQDASQGQGRSSEANTAKVIIAGAAAVGKTCILQRYCGGHRGVINTEYEPTVVADFRVVDVPARSSSVKLQIWDSSGDLKQQKLSRALFRNAVCLLLVFDITSLDSFNVLDTYWNNYIQFSDVEDVNDFPVVLVGNKCDLSNLRAVSMEVILDWCANKRPRKPVTYIECSALRNIQVGDVFLVAGDYTYDYLNSMEGDEEEEEEEEEDENANNGGRGHHGENEDGGHQEEEENIDNYNDDENDEDINRSEVDEHTHPHSHSHSQSHGHGRNVNNSESNYKQARRGHGAGVPLQTQSSKQTSCFDFSGFFKWYVYR